MFQPIFSCEKETRYGKDLHAPQDGPPLNSAMDASFKGFLNSTDPSSHRHHKPTREVSNKMRLRFPQRMGNTVIFLLQASLSDRKSTSRTTAQG